MLTVESFNGRLRDDSPNEHLFANLRHARVLISAWRDGYNQNRPHTRASTTSPRAGLPPESGPH